MAEKITEKQAVDTVKEAASFLITQTETVNGAEVEALRRATLDAVLKALKVGDLNKLSTETKESLVAAINEAALSGGGVGVSAEEPELSQVKVWISTEEGEEFLAPEIKDDTVSEQDTWSSQKIAAEIQAAAGGGSGEGAAINDAAEALTSTWSSKKINTKVEEVRQLAEKRTAVNDEAVSETETWSSSKVVQEIEKASPVTTSASKPVNHDWWEDKTPLTEKGTGVLYTDARMAPYSAEGTFYIFCTPVTAGNTYQFSRVLDENGYYAQTMTWVVCTSDEPVLDEENSRYSYTPVGSRMQNLKTAFTVPEGVRYIIFTISKANYDAITAAYTITMQQITAANPEPSYPIQAVNENVLKPEVRVPASSVYQDEMLRIDCIGDSLTAGAGTTRDGNEYPDAYPEVLAELIGQAVHNLGVGGEDIETILGRTGALPMMVQPGITIPAGQTAVAVTLRSITGAEVAPLRQYTDFDKGVNPCSIAGVTGTLAYDETSAVYAFTRTKAGTAVSVDRPAQLITDSAQVKSNNRVLILWMGQNNADNEDMADVAAFTERMIDVHRAAIAHAQTDKYIILSAPIDEPTAHGTSVYASLYQRMQYAFGAHYINIVDYLLTYGLADAGLEATEGDTANIAANRIPASIRSDGIHLNAAGYKIVAEQVYKRGRELGYW